MDQGRISREDRELAAAAKKKAGSAAALGRAFGVSKQTASGWGRTEPLGRHLRERLRAYVATPIKADQASPSAPGRPRDFWQLEGVRDRRSFTAMVEALRMIDARGTPKEWATAWTTIKATFMILAKLANWNDDVDWRRIFEGGDHEPIDHWRALTQREELSLTEETRQ